MEISIKHLRKKEAEEIKKHQGALVDYGIDLRQFKAAQKAARNSEDSAPPLPEPKRPNCRRFIVGDITTEAIADRLEKNPRGLLMVQDELSGFFYRMNQYKSGGKGGDEAAYLAMHGGRSLVIDRKNPDKPQIYVPLAALSIVGAIQPGVLKRVLTRERMESGMAARFLLAYPPTRRTRWIEECIEQVVEDRLSTMFDWLAGIELQFDDATGEPIPRMLPLTTEAKQLWIEFHNEHAAEQAEMQGDLSAAWAKLTGYAARLSLLCELAAWSCGDNYELPTHVSAASMQAGIALGRWFSVEAMRIYAILQESPQEQEIRELITYIHQRGGALTERDLSRGPRRYRDKPGLASLDLQHLVNAGVGVWTDVNTGLQGGRPSRAFQLLGNPGGDETPVYPGINDGSGTVATNFESERAPDEGEYE